MEYERQSMVGYRQNRWLPSSNFPGLGGFDLKFEEKDHKIRCITAGGTTSERPADSYDYLLGMYDHSAISEERDVVRGEAKFLNLGELPTYFASGIFSGSGQGMISIPPINAEQLFVLRGFYFAKTGDHDHNIKKIAVRHQNTQNAISVVFQDDSPEDDGFECRVLYGVVDHARAGYNRHTQFFGPFSTEFRFTESTEVTKEEPGNVLLTGF